MRFTWDPKKAAFNLKKHGTTFEEAQTVFEDPLALVQADRMHSDRMIILGVSSQARTLFVVYAESHVGDTFRIVSARQATNHERKAYEEE